MSLTLETLQRLDDLYARGPQTAVEARSLSRSIPWDELASWLQERVTNPTAERYLLSLFFAACGNPGLYRRFYRELMVRLRPRLRRHVMQGGNISQVTEIVGSPIVAWRQPDTRAPMPVVYKKMPPFLDRTEAEAYVQRYLEYNTVLRDEVGIAVPHFDARIIEPGSGQVLIYVVQERVDPASVCHRLLRETSLRTARQLYALILGEYEKLYRFNRARASDGYQLGLDGQIPNWAIADYDGDPRALTGEEQLLYLDTNVPMIRVDGQDVVSADMYFQDLPGAARWGVMRLGLDQEVMDRYFQIRVIIVDFVGNTILHHREDLAPLFVEMSNEALAGPFAKANLEPITLEEVQRYARSDLALWRLWRSLKLFGTDAGHASGGSRQPTKLPGMLYRIWTEPIF
jgi:hypothetical protein